MPNHVTNNLTITGVSRKKSSKILCEIGGCDPENPKVFRAIDFNRIIPMPESLSCEAGSIGETALLAIYGIDTNKYFPINQTEAKKRLKEMDKKTKQEAIKLAEIYKKNLECYGAINWYDWCCDNWGTKWNAYNIERNYNDNEIRFDTAWATPTPVIKAMSKMFPDATFTVSFADEDLGQNCGSYAFKDGQLFNLYEPKYGSEEAVQFACEIKRLDYNEISDDYMFNDEDAPSLSEN